VQPAADFGVAVMVVDNGFSVVLVAVKLGMELVPVLVV